MPEKFLDCLYKVVYDLPAPSRRPWVASNDLVVGGSENSAAFRNRHVYTHTHTHTDIYIYLFIYIGTV